jgi:hypothetical protein
VENIFSNNTLIFFCYDCRPTGNCVKTEETSQTLDRAMTVFSVVSLAMALFSFIYHVKSPVRRAWPKRTVTWLSFSVFLLEGTYSIGAFVGYNQLKHQDDGGTWQAVCVAQGAMFNWSAVTMVLMLFWFHYTQFKMLCRQIPSAELQRKEFGAISLIFVTSTVLTALPLFTNHVQARTNFYGCWIDDGFFYWLFYLLLMIVLVTSNYWCYQSVQWLSKVAEVIMHEIYVNKYIEEEEMCKIKC